MSIGAVSGGAAGPVEAPRGPGFEQRVAQRWKALYGGDVGVERFKTAAGDDRLVSWEEAKAAHLPGERLGGYGRERFDFYAGEDGQLSAREAQNARAFEASAWNRTAGHHKAAWEAAKAYLKNH